MKKRVGGWHKATRIIRFKRSREDKKIRCHIGRRQSLRSFTKCYPLILFNQKKNWHLGWKIWSIKQKNIQLALSYTVLKIVRVWRLCYSHTYSFSYNENWYITGFIQEVIHMFKCMCNINAQLSLFSYSIYYSRSVFITS